MASDDEKIRAAAALKAVVASLREQGVQPADDGPSEPLPPIMADPARVFRHGPAEGGKTLKQSELLKGAKRAASAEDSPRIAQIGPGDSPSPKKAAE